jgi:urease accessory protein
VGAFSYSHGLEWAIEDGTVATIGDLEAWITGVLTDGAGRNDAILLRAAHAATGKADAARVAEIAILAAAFQPTRERRLEAIAQGNAFLETVARTWDDGADDGERRSVARFAAEVAALMPEPAAWSYPVAVGLAAACHGLPVEVTVQGYLQAFAANLISAGVRAVPLGQTEGQRAIARLTPIYRAVTEATREASVEDLGGAALAADIASMRHETQYTRLFRS